MAYQTSQTHGLVVHYRIENGKEHGRQSVHPQEHGDQPRVHDHHLLDVALHLACPNVEEHAHHVAGNTCPS